MSLLVKVELLLLAFEECFNLCIIFSFSLKDFGVPSLLEFVNEPSGLLVEGLVLIFLLLLELSLGDHELLIFKLSESVVLDFSFIEAGFSLKLEDFLLE